MIMIMIMIMIIIMIIIIIIIIIIVDLFKLTRHPKRSVSNELFRRMYEKTSCQENSAQA